MQFGLFAGGAVSGSFLMRLPGLARRLGPVTAVSYRLASRIVNTLRAGRPVKDASALDPCRTILICVPENTLLQAVGMLAGADIEWAGKTLLLCESAATSRSLDCLRARGAAAASVAGIEGSAGHFLVEGDTPAIRYARRLIADLGGKAVEFDTSRMAFYDAGRALATSMFTPLIAACVECLSTAGRNPASAARIAETLLQRTLRAYLQSGKKSWSGPLALGNGSEVRRQLAVLGENKPQLADYYRKAAVSALEYFERHPKLRGDLGSRTSTDFEKS